MLLLNKRTYSLLPYSLLGIFLGSYILIACSLSTVWNILLIAGLLTLFTVLVSKDWLRLSIFFVVLSLPLSFSKGLVQLKGVYVPSLLLQLSDFFVLGALIVWVWRIITKEQAFPQWRKIHTLGFLVLAWFGISTLTAHNFALGFFEWLIVFKCFLFFLLVSDYFVDRKIAKTLLYALFLSVVLQILVATAQQVLQNPLFIQGMKGAAVSFGLHGFETFRPRGTLEHPMQLSSFLLYSQPIIFSFAYFYLKGIKKSLFFIVFLGSIFLQIWTYSRIGWVSMVCIAIVFIFLLIKKRLLTSRNMVILGLCAIMISAVLGVYHNKISDRLFGYDNMSTKYRRVMEHISFKIISDNPIMGIGFGNYAPATDNVLPDNYNLVGKEGVKSIAGKHYVHNGYLLLFAETGIIGIILWLTFFGNILLCGYRNIIKSKDQLHLCLSIGVFLALIGLLVNMSLEHFRNNMLTLIMWMCAGLIIALGNWNREDMF